MLRSALGFFRRRCSLRMCQHQAMSSFVSARAISILVYERNYSETIAQRQCRFSSSRNDDTDKGGVRGSVHWQKEEDDDDDEEAWVPPVRFQPSHITGDTTSESFEAATSISSSETLIPKSERIETILEASRQTKEQERFDRALEEAEREVESLLQLSEEEQATLSDEEILERIDFVLKREEELEEEIFQKELQREEEWQRKDALSKQQQDPVATDWLRNRRVLLERDNSTFKNVVPIVHHTLLEADEIISLLEAHGGEDIVVIDDDPEAPRMGGADGMIFCTGGGSSRGKNPRKSLVNNIPYLISTLSRVLIDHMKDRKLHEIGIAPSAKQNTTNRAEVSAPTMYGSGSTSPNESWKIVDCGNYIVHIMDDATRWDLDLEELWSGADPLWNLNVFDDDAVENYCEKHHVPPSYNGTGSMMYGNDDSVDSAFLKKLEKGRFGSSRRHKPVIPQSIKNRDRRIGRKKRRERRERDYFGSFD